MFLQEPSGVTPQKAVFLNCYYKKPVTPINFNYVITENKKENVLQPPGLSRSELLDLACNGSKLADSGTWRLLE
jgi:hypothetical protein